MRVCGWCGGVAVWSVGVEWSGVWCVERCRVCGVVGPILFSLR